MTRVPPFIHKTLVPLFLLLCCPPTVFIVWYIATALDGSILSFANLVVEQGFFATLSSIWGPYFFGTTTAWKIIASFAAFELLLMKIVPGKPFTGPITPQGNVPLYKANGIACFSITMAAFFLGSYFQYFSATILYDNLGGILGALNCFSLLFCLFLYFKGIYAPSSSDASKTGNFLFDYYWGTELYPRILGWDVKMFTNCRFGMMSWCLLLFSYAAKQQELYGSISDSMFVAVALQLVYVTKFFVWETGYLRSLDIMHDRAGFMICWGCLVWVPSVYTLSTLYLVNHPVELGLNLSALIFLLGASSIMINYFADRQRQQVRATNGNCSVWGAKPKLISASYQTERGETKQTILLASGWWGLSRHFHYIPEILGAFFWALPALFTNALPYFYVLFLTILLVDRAFRHDKRCADKYGKYWGQYCKQVPYKIIPYVY